jgi:subtilisin family serine protease
MDIASMKEELLMKNVNRAATKTICGLMCAILILSGVSGSFIPDDVLEDPEDWQYFEDHMSIVHAWDPANISSEPTGDRFTNPGRNQIVVAVLDTGIASENINYTMVNDYAWWSELDFNVTDLWDDIEINLWQNPDEPKGDPDDVDGDGITEESYNDDNNSTYDDDYCGIDFVDDDGDGRLNEDGINYDNLGQMINDDDDYYIDFDGDGRFTAYAKSGQHWVDYGEDMIVDDNGDTPGKLDCDSSKHTNLDTPLRDEEGHFGNPSNDGMDLTPLVNEDHEYPIATVPLRHFPEALRHGDFHGTSVAGIVGAVADNNVGGTLTEVAGVSQISIMPIRTTTASLFVQDLQENETNIAEKYLEVVNLKDALAYARTHGADIISYSGGIPYDYLDVLDATDEFDLSATNAEIEACWNDGILLVAAGGNNASDAEIQYPARSEYVIAVGGTKEHQEPHKRDDNNYGADMEVLAPASNVRTYSYGSWGSETGTSMACPYVSGTAALVWSYFPKLTNAELRNIIQATAQIDTNSDKGIWWNEDFYNEWDGYGEVNTFYTFMAANMMHREWYLNGQFDDDGDYLPSIMVRPKVAVDGRGYTHIVYLSGGDLFYNVFKPDGQPLIKRNINLPPLGNGGQEWADICVDAGNAAHIVWVEVDTISQVTRIVYCKIDENGNFEVNPSLSVQGSWPSYLIRRYYEYLNVMVDDYVNPPNVHLVFIEYMWDVTHQTRTNNIIQYYRLNATGVPKQFRALVTSIESLVTEVSADIGNKLGRTHINFVWTHWQNGGTAIMWSQYDWQLNVLVPFVQLTFDENPSPHIKVQPNIDTDFDTCRSYAVWVHRSPTGGDPWPTPCNYIEYATLNADGGDGCGWQNIKVHKIGETVGIPQYPDNQTVFYPQISHRSNLKQRDVSETALERKSFSTVVWSRKASEGPHYDLRYTEITYDGRELVPDGDFKDGLFEGEKEVSPDNYNVFSDIDSEFETISNDLFDNCGGIRLVSWDSNGDYNFISTNEIWRDRQDIDDGYNMDNCADSQGSIHYVYDEDGTIYYNEYDGSWQHSPAIVVFDTTQDGSHPRILITDSVGGERVHIIWNVDDVNLYYARYSINGVQQIAPTTLGCYGTPPTGWALEDHFDISFDDRMEKIHVVWSGRAGSSGNYKMKHGSIGIDNSQYHPEALVKDSGSDPIMGSIDIGRDSYPVVVYWILGDLYFRKLAKGTTGGRLVDSEIQIHDTSDGFAEYSDIMFDKDINRRGSNTQLWNTIEKNDESIHVVFLVRNIQMNPSWRELRYIRLDNLGYDIVPERCVYAQDYREIEKTMGTPPLYLPEIGLDRNNQIHVVYADLNFDDHKNYNLPNGNVVRHVFFDNNGQLLTAPQILQRYNIHKFFPIFPFPDPNVDSSTITIAPDGTISIGFGDVDGELHHTWPMNI